MKKGKHPTTSRKNRQKKIKATYAKAREEAQLAGVIPTEPVGAVRDERVSASKQTDQPLPELTSQAIRNGWAVPEEKKPELVDELARIVESPEVPTKVKVAAFNALRLADQTQYERDHPEEAGKAKGGAKVGVVVANQLGVSTGNVFDDIRRDVKAIEGSQVHTTPVSDVQAHGATEPLDAPQSDHT